MKKIVAIVKLQIPAGKATPAPPVGPGAGSELAPEPPFAEGPPVEPTESLEPMEPTEQPAPTPQTKAAIRPSRPILSELATMN